ncbi:MAG: AAA family ATPase [Sporomusaceae bacterium]|nr:AAA family ATPase [Sporomusaceae bacterium]
MLEAGEAFIRSLRLQIERIDDYNRYPFCLPLFRQLSEIALHPRVTFFVGENGSGKSTLLEAIAVARGFNPEGGTFNFTFSSRPSHSELCQYISLVKGTKRLRDGFFLRAESFYNLATAIEDLDASGIGRSVIDSYGGRSLHEQSHGESFFAAIQNRFGGDGLYILDEPEAALSPLRQMALLTRLHQLVEQNSQFIIATHSPILLAYPDAWIYQFAAGNPCLQQVAYEQTEHYMITRQFLNNYPKMLEILLKR